MSPNNRKRLAALKGRKFGPAQTSAEGMIRTMERIERSRIDREARSASRLSQEGRYEIARPGVPGTLWRGILFGLGWLTLVFLPWTLVFWFVL